MVSSTAVPSPSFGAGDERSLPPNQIIEKGRPMMEDEDRLPSGAFTKLDTEDDEFFYEPPRLV